MENYSGAANFTVFDEAANFREPNIAKRDTGEEMNVISRESGEV